MRQALGILAGILSGLVFTSSSIAQKRAIDSIGAGAPLFRNLVKSPLWLAGFAASFAIGAPLNMAAYMAIGPTLPPALSAISLAAVPILARVFLGDRPPARSYAGAAAVALAVACIGLSGLAIAPESVDWLDHSFLLRAAIAVSCAAAVSAVCVGLGLRSRSAGGAFFALSAGVAQALTNAFMAPIAGQLGLLVAGSFGAAGLVIAGTVSVALAAVNFGAIALAQLALCKGVAVTVIPLQQLPIQAIPIILHVWLYRGSLGEAPETALLGSGLALLLAGAYALGFGKKAARGMAPAAVACLAILSALALPAHLGAQEAAAKTAVYRYACLDDTGRKTASIEMRVTSRDGATEIVSADSAGNRGYARLGARMVQEEVRLDSYAGQVRRFRLAASGESWETEGCPEGTYSRAGNACLGDRSLLFILPAIIDPEIKGREARFVLIRPESGQRATMRLRAEGIVELGGINGSRERAYLIRMELADPIGRLFWPYTYSYYYGIGDLRLLAYDGPDENKRNSRIVLEGVQG